MPPADCRIAPNSCADDWGGRNCDFAPLVHPCSVEKSGERPMRTVAANCRSFGRRLRAPGSYPSPANRIKTGLTCFCLKMQCFMRQFLPVTRLKQAPEMLRCSTSTGRCPSNTRHVNLAEPSSRSRYVRFQSAATKWALPCGKSIALTEFLD